MAQVIKNLALQLTAKKQRFNCPFKTISQNGKYAIVEITDGEFKGSQTDAISTEDPAFAEGKADFYVGTRQGKAYLQADTLFNQKRSALNRVVQTTSNGAIRSVKTLEDFASLSANHQEALLKLTAVLAPKTTGAPSGLPRKELTETPSAELG